MTDRYPGKKEKMKIENVEQLSLGGNTVATFSAYFEDMQFTIHKIKLIRTKKGGLIISLPSYYSGVNLQKSWAPYIEFSLEKGKQFYQDAFQQLKEFGIPSTGG